MRRLLKRHWVWFWVLLFALAGTGGILTHWYLRHHSKGEINGANAKKIEEGMTSEEVEELLGPARIEGRKPFIAKRKANHPELFGSEGVQLSEDELQKAWCNDRTTVIVRFRAGKVVDFHFNSEDKTTQERIAAWFRRWF